SYLDSCFGNWNFSYLDTSYWEELGQYAHLFLQLRIVFNHLVQALPNMMYQGKKNSNYQSSYQGRNS
ncbi:hypothetical protein ACUOCP_47310, partial [Escherichia sp. R-CC3]